MSDSLGRVLSEGWSRCGVCGRPISLHGGCSCPPEKSGRTHSPVPIIAEALVWAGGAGGVTGASRVGMEPYTRRAEAIVAALTEQGWTLAPPVEALDV